jgi:hypothetical protein
LTPGPNNTWLLTHAGEPASVVVSGVNVATPTDLTSKALGNQEFHLLDAMVYNPETHKGHKMYVRGLLIKLATEQRMTISTLEMVSPSCIN